MKRVNEIMGEHGSSPSKITVRTFVGTSPDKEGDGVPPQDYVLIEGDATSLRFLAESILAQVDSDYGCTLNIHPNGAGSNHF